MGWTSFLKRGGLMYLLTRNDSSLNGSEVETSESTYFLSYLNKRRVHFNKNSLENILPSCLDILEFDEIKFYGRSGSLTTAWKMVAKKR